MMEWLSHLWWYLAPAERAGVPVLAAIAWWIPLLLSGALSAGTAVASRRGGNDGDGEGLSGIDPELLADIRRMLDLQEQEYLRADPLRLATMQLAYRMLPTFAREGTSLGLSSLTPGDFSGGGGGGGGGGGRGGPSNEDILERARRAGVNLTLDDVIRMRERVQGREIGGGERRWSLGPTRTGRRLPFRK